VALVQQENNMLKIITLLLISITLFSCSEKDQIAKEAISAFSTDFSPKIDPKLEKTAIILPNAVINPNFHGNFTSNNQKIEHFALNQKIIQTNNIFNGYVTSSPYDIISNPIIANNIIYSLDARGNLIARNIANFKLIYRKKIINWRNIKNLSQSKLFYDQNIIYVTSGFNEILAINAKNSDIIWSKKLNSIAISRAITDQNNLYIITNDNKTYALDKINANIKWVHNGIVKKTVIFGAADPVIYKNYIISAYSSGEIYVLDQKNGQIIDFYELNSSRAINSNFILDDIDATPIISDDILYAVGNSGIMMAIDLKNQNKLWQKNISSISNFWIAGDFIYLIDNENRLICLSKNNGGIKFFTQLDKYHNKKQLIHYFGLVLAGNNLILTNSNREMILISPFDGKIIKKYKFSKKIQHRAIIADKKLYLHLKGRFDTQILIFE
jgi:outer membrane protein assembly factor BamB